MGTKINPLFKLLGITDIYSEFDKTVDKIGWSNGCKWLIKSLGIEYTAENVNNHGKAQIIIANHPTGVDPYLLTAILGRNDSYFWGDIYQSKKGINISKHIILIAPRPFWTILRRPLTNWPGYIYMRLTSPVLTKEQTKEINKNSMEKTIGLLRKGNQIIIFPSGGEYEFLKPAKGVFYLIKKCQEQKISVKVTKLQITNFGELGLFFHFLFKTKITARITVVNQSQLTV